MTRKRKLLIAGASAVALAAAGVGMAQAVGGDSEEQVTGPDADRAGRAAADAVVGGRVVGVERADEGGAGWEVEVVRGDGRRLEVRLSPSFEPVGTQPDDDGAGDRDQGGEGD